MMNDYVDILFKIQNQYLQKEMEFQAKEDEEAEENGKGLEQVSEHPQRKKSLRDEDRKAIVSLYEKGLNRKEIIKVYKDYNPNSVSRVINDIKRERILKENEKIVKIAPKVREYKDKGYSDLDISELLELSLKELRVIYEKARFLLDKDPFDGKEDDECWRKLGFTYDEADRIYELLLSNKTPTEISVIVDISVQKVNKCIKELQSRGIYGKNLKEKNPNAQLYLGQGTIYDDFFKSIKFTPRDVEYFITEYEAGESDASIYTGLGKRKASIDKCKKLLNHYGIRVIRGKPTVYPEGWSIKMFQVDAPEIEESGYVGIPNDSDGKIDDISKEDKTKYIEMKRAGYSNLEIQEALSLSDKNILHLIRECKKYQIKF